MLQPRAGSAVLPRWNVPFILQKNVQKFVQRRSARECKRGDIHTILIWVGALFFRKFDKFFRWSFLMFRTNHTNLDFLETNIPFSRLTPNQNMLLPNTAVVSILTTKKHGKFWINIHTLFWSTHWYKWFSNINIGNIDCDSAKGRKRRKNYFDLQNQ